MSYGFVDYSDYYADGIFRCGSDFEAGEYYIISLYGIQASCEVSTDPNEFKWADSKIIRKVNIVDGQYVKAKNSVLVSSNEIKSEYRNQYGIFLIGEDIPSGDYKITSITNSYHSDLMSIIGVDGSYHICNSFGNTLHCSDVYESQAYISVEEGQYLIVNNLKMELCTNYTNSSQSSSSTSSYEEGLEVVGFKVDTDTSSNYIDYSIGIKNRTNKTINTVSIGVLYLDDNNVVVDTSFPQEGMRVNPDEVVYIRGLVKKGTASQMTVDYYTYYTETDPTYNKCYFTPRPESISLEVSGEKIFAES